MRPWDLIEGLPDLLIPEDPRAFAQRFLERLAAYAESKCAVLFAREQDWMQLFASRGIDQSALDLVEDVWQRRRDALSAGQPFMVRPEGAAPEMPAVGAALEGVTWLAVLPVFAQGRLAGLLYVDSQRPEASDDGETLGQLARIAAIALRLRPARAPEPVPLIDLLKVPSAELLREQLLRLLEEHEWNIARVARILKVSRVTIYKRLERFGVERKRVIKSPHRQPA